MKTIIKTVLALALISPTLGTKAQKKTHTISVERIISAPADQVWKVVGEDFGAIANSHPKIISSNYINGSLNSGEGAERQCNFNEKGTKYLKEKQISYSPENHSFKVQIIHSGSFPLDADLSYGNYKVEKIDNKTSKFIMDFTYRTKPAFLGGIAKGKFKEGLTDYTIAVAHHVLTGEIVNQENFEEIKKKY